jgi:hypothetical protein
MKPFTTVEMNLKEATPYLLVFIVLVSVATSLTYIGKASGNQNTRNELVKHIGILTSVNLLASIFLGVLLYYYVLSNPGSFVPFTIVLLTFNLFLSIMSVSIAVLVQSS